MGITRAAYCEQPGLEEQQPQFGGKTIE